MDIKKFLEERGRDGVLRTLKPLGWPSGGKILYKGKEYIDFSLNDYLGLSDHPRLIAKAKEALDRYGTSSSASRLLSGDIEIHHLLEDRTAQFNNKEAALVLC